MTHGYIAVKFDDGNKTDYTIALQEQLDRGMIPKGTSFIVGASIRLGSPNALSIEDCIALRDAGWSLQDHTYNHGPTDTFINMTGSQLLNELHLQNSFFETYLEMPKPTIFQCPGGRINKTMYDIIALERRAITFGHDRLLVTPFTNRFEIPQTTASVSIETRHQLIDDAMEHGYAINFGFHELTIGGAMHAAYCDILDYGNRIGATFVTIEEELDIFGLKGIHRKLDPKIGSI